MGKKGKKSSRQADGKKSGGDRSIAIYTHCRHHFHKTLKKLSHDAVVSNVRKGYLQTTLCISEYLADGPDSQDPENRRFLKNLVNEGLVSAVLEKLNRCDESIDALSEGAGTVIGENGTLLTLTFDRNIEGSVIMPTIWLNLLIRITKVSAGSLKVSAGSLDPITQKKCVNLISNEIGKFVLHISDDVTCELYQSKDYWIQCVSQFTLLLFNLIAQPTGVNVEVTRALVKHEGLLSFLVRSIFWESSRPDIVALADGNSSVLDQIVQEYSSGSIEGSALKRIGFASAGILAGMMTAVQKESWCKFYYETEDREWIGAAASTATTNTLYDASCVESFVSGMIRLLKTKPTSDDAGSWMDCLQRTVLAGCVDADVIKGVIDIGNQPLHSLQKAVHICRAAMDMMFTVDDSPNKMNVPSDTYLAYAVSKGIIEMFLGFLSRFGCVGDIWTIALSSVDMISEASNQPKTSKALRYLSKKKEFEIALVSAERDPKFNCRQGTQLLSAIRWVVPSAERVCLGCNKTIPAKEAKSCSRCHAIYCGRECQVSHWKVHKQQCKKVDSKQGKQQAMNRNCSQLDPVDLFRRNEESLLVEATICGWDIFDCVVLVTSLFPPRLNIMNRNDKKIKELSKELSADSYLNKSRELGVLHIMVVVQTEGHLMALTSYGESTPWSEAQEGKRHELRDKLLEFKRHPERRVKFLNELRQQRYDQADAAGAGS